MSHFLRTLMALAALTTFTLTAAAHAADHASATSPDGVIRVTVETDGDARIGYRVERGGQPVIATSRLGLLLTDALPLVRGFAFDGAETTTGAENWEQPWGERRYVRGSYTDLVVRFHQNDAAQRRMAIRFRLFNDGIGFRYEFPQQASMAHLNIADEMTEFTIAQPGEAWWIQGGEWNRYEQVYQHTAIDAVATAHTPITMKLADGTHLSFHEAALVDYAAYWLKRADGRRFRTMLAPSSRGARVSRDAPFNTPWRTVRMASNAAGLVESDLELNLNEPNKLGDVSWFKPQKYVGIWWGMIAGTWTWAEGPRHGATTARAMQHIDFAAKHGFGGVLVEGWNKGWNGQWMGKGDEYSFTEAVPDFDLKAVTDHARKMGVKLIGHHETGGNIVNYEAQLEPAMALYERLGVNTVKTGYVADAGGIIAEGDIPGAVRMEWHDGQRQVNHHLHVVQVAARHHIAINAHEPVKDTGLRRTWPNWVSREGARGMEYNAWGQFANGPDHEPTLVYTRMLAGPMDFTPGVLSLKSPSGNALASTRAKQLGLYLALYSPIQMAADLIENLDKYPRELDFIARVPADWEQSKLLTGEVGDYAIFVRKDRNSADWYVGGVNDATARTLDLAFDFLDPGKTYTATIYRDGPGATYETEARGNIVIETRKVKQGDHLSLWLAPGGGAAIRLAPGN